MRVLVTGANGFVGRHLVEHLSAQGGFSGTHPPYDLLTLVDVRFDRKFANPRIRLVEGSLVDCKVIDQTVHPPSGLCVRSGQCPWTRGRTRL
jgi:nucleoside-diphosphate-sugar epimerase